MTSRKIVLKALNHQEPDRVPVDFGGHRSSGIMAIAYAKLKKYMGITTGNIHVYDMIQQLAIVEPEILDRFNVDTIELGRGFAQEPDYWKDWVLPDGTPCKIPAFINPVKKNGDWVHYSEDGTQIAVQGENSFTFDQVCFPLRENRNLDNIEKYLEKVMWYKMGTPPAPIEFDEKGLRQLEQGAEKLFNTTDKAIIGLFGGSLVEFSQFLLGMEEFLCEMADNPEGIHGLLDKLVEFHLSNLEKYLSAVGSHIDIILFSDDLGMQTGPQFSPKMYDEFFKERHRTLWKRTKQLTDAKVMLHCCGGIYPLIRGLIDSGVDIINPVQTSAKDMEPERLKKEFGKDMVFWGGGCDTQKILPSGTPEEVREDVKRRVEMFAPGGGFVFQQIHNILAGVPPENIVAMFDAVNA